MTGVDELFLHEEILLLSLRDDTGTMETGTQYSYGLGGAVLAELLLRERIAVDDSKKRKLAVIRDSTPVGDPVIDEALEQVRGGKRRASLQTWVGRFARMKNLRHRVAKGLCRRGILKADEDKVLLLFTRKIYPELDPRPERQLIERLRGAIFTDKAEINSRTVVLVSLSRSAGLLRPLFDKKRLKSRAKRIESMVNGELTGKATREAVAAMQTAILVAAVIVPITMSH